MSHESSRLETLSNLKREDAKLRRSELGDSLGVL